MERGELYRATPDPQDPRRTRIFLVVSRPELIQSNYSTVICAPVYSTRSGLASELEVDEREGLNHPSAARCDELVSMVKQRLTRFVGVLQADRLPELDRALAAALGIDPSHL